MMSFLQQQWLKKCASVTVYSKILRVQDEWDRSCFKLPKNLNYDNLEHTITYILVV